MPIEFHPVTGFVGAEVTGIDLSADNPASAYQDIRDGFNKYGVLFFRDQNITPEQQVSFARQFGELFINKSTVVPAFEGCEGLESLRSDPNNKFVVGGDWHSDQEHRDDPCEMTALYCLECPDFGGDTVFTSTAAAYDHLPDTLKTIVDNLKAVRSHAYIVRRGFESFGDFDSRNPIILNDHAEAVHPVVKIHPETGRKVLYLSPGYAYRFEGLSHEQSLPLMSTLFEFMQLPDFQCRWRWKPGSLAMWDNRQTWHYASNDYPGKPRYMRRMVVRMRPNQKLKLVANG